jgi:hypothetical protein
VRVGVLASAGRDRLPGLPHADDLVVQPQVGRVPGVRDATPGRGPLTRPRRDPAGLTTWH